MKGLVMWLTVAVLVLGVAAAGCCCLVGNEKDNGPAAEQTDAQN